MALVQWTSIDHRLAQLRRQFESLENELFYIQSDYYRLRQEHEQKCAAALMEALSSLINVIDYVNKTDKALIFWVEKGGSLKVALRLIGIDRRTDTIVRRNTTIIKDQVSEVEASFNRSSEAFKDGLAAIQNLNTRLARYSVTSIGRAQGDLSVFSMEIEGKIKEVSQAITKLESQSRMIEKKASEVPGQIRAVESQRRRAQQAANSSAKRSAAGVGAGILATVAGIFFPPLLPLAAPVAIGAYGYGTGKAIHMAGFDRQTSSLRAREQELSSKLGDLRSQIWKLEGQMPLLSQKRESFFQTKNDTLTLEGKCAGLRRESQTILNEIHQARQVLSSMIFKTEAIAADLSECEYAKTRREIAGRLNSLVQGLYDMGNRHNITYDTDGTALILLGMSILQGRTQQVLRIMGSQDGISPTSLVRTSRRSKVRKLLRKGG